MFGALAHMEGDHVDRDSLAHLSRTRAPRRRSRRSSDGASFRSRWRGASTVHAVVRHAVKRRTLAMYEPGRAFEYYVSLLEREPARLMLEQTHLFAAMDHAHRRGDLSSMLRIERLLDSVMTRTNG